MQRRLGVLACCALLASGGCGKIAGLRHEDAPPTRSAWLIEAEAACAGALAAMHAQGLQLLQDPAPGGDVVRHRAALRARRLGFVEVGELRPPVGLGDRIRAFTQAATGGIDELTARSRALEQGDLTEEKTTRDRAASQLATARRLASELGFSACVP